MRVEYRNFQGSWDDNCPHCGQKQELHKMILGEFDGVRLEHRMPCESEKKKISATHRAQTNVGQTIVFVGWILVPLIIAVAGFASFYVGIALFIYSLFQIYIQWIKLYGNPDKWISGHKARSKKNLRMRHYYYHCERNSKVFERLREENETEQDAAANP